MRADRGIADASTLAREVEPGVWTISEKLEPTLRELVERGGIVRTMYRALAERGAEDYIIDRDRIEQGSSWPAHR